MRVFLLFLPNKKLKEQIILLTVASGNCVINFHAKIKNPSIVNLNIVYTVFFPVRGKFASAGTFHFREKIVRNMHVFL